MPARDMIGKTTGGVMRLIRNHRAPNRALGLPILGLSAFSSAARPQTMTGEHYDARVSEDLETTSERRAGEVRLRVTLFNDSA
jgi:hypothetical protein